MEDDSCNALFNALNRTPPFNQPDNQSVKASRSSLHKGETSGQRGHFCKYYASDKKKEKWGKGGMGKVDETTHSAALNEEKVQSHQGR
ncbi:hypothetical protein BgiMline_000385 [Biomphalaria glabrata]|nr:hypothetical protein BgiMline_000366 [Biomphalaria glabrata]